MDASCWLFTRRFGEMPLEGASRYFGTASQSGAPECWIGGSFGPWKTYLGHPHLPPSGIVWSHLPCEIFRANFRSTFIDLSCLLLTPNIEVPRKFPILFWKFFGSSLDLPVWRVPRRVGPGCFPSGFQANSERTPSSLDTEYDRAKVPPYNGNDPPPTPGSLTALLFPPLLNEEQNKGTQREQARYGGELPPFISIVRCPGRPVILRGDSLLDNLVSFHQVLVNLIRSSSVSFGQF